MRFRFKVIVLGLALIAAMLALATRSHSAAWSKDPVIHRFFQSLRQPDNTSQSCCGEADAYFADEFHVDSNGDYIAIITDDRDDLVPDDNLNRQDDDDGISASGPHYRQHRAIGTLIRVPGYKVGCTSPNISGHGLLFMPQMGKSVQALDDGIDHAVYDGKGGAIIPYCYCPPTMG